MGLTENDTQTILKRLQILIKTAGKKCYTFAMGRLNEAKLSNFPEIDIFCLISNDDNALIPPKYVYICYLKFIINVQCLLKCVHVYLFIFHFSLLY